MQRLGQALVIVLLILAPIRVYAGPSEDVASAVDLGLWRSMPITSMHW